MSKIPKQLWLGTSDLPVTLEASVGDGEKKLRRFSMTAYTGGAMTPRYFSHPVVVDLAGLSLASKARPIFLNHDPERIVGHTDKLELEGMRLLVAGVISGVGEAVAQVVGAADNGFPWQASIGAKILQAVFVPEGAKAEANGKTWAGPVVLVRKSVLFEVSFVPLGADDKTSAQVAAGFAGDHNQGEVLTMKFEEWVQAKGKKLADLGEAELATLKAQFERESAGGGQAGSAGGGTSEPPSTGSEAVRQARLQANQAVQAERDRVAGIQELCAGEFPRLEQEAIKSGWSVDETSQKVLKAMRENRPAPAPQVLVKTGTSYDRKHLEAALCLRAGIPDAELVKAYGEQVVEGAWADREMSLQQLFAECARLEGVSMPRSFCNDSIRAGFSTVSLPGVLNNVANKRLLRAFLAQPVIATKLCSEGELNDFKESERYRLTDVGDLEPVAPDGELKHGGLREDKATNQVQTYGKIFALTREMIFNDDLGAFMKVPEGMGARSSRKIDQLFFTRLLSNPAQGDGKALFHTDHGNYKEGSTTALDMDSLALAVQMFLDQTDADGQPISVAPKFLLLPTALKMTGRELLNSTMLISVGSTDKKRIPTFNPLAGEDLELVSSPYLANTKYTGASAKAWYLFADPAVVDTFEIGYLKGRRVPTVEKGETDFDTLGIKFRVFFDLGVREQDHRGMVKFKGEA